jgi:hypothetical protein
MTRASLLAIAAVLTVPPDGNGQEPGATGGSSGIAYGIETNLASRYVFRGIAYSPGPVNQSSASVTIASLTVYAWGNVLLEPDSQQETLSELDFGASYARTWKTLTLEGAVDGYVYRYRPDALRPTPSTAEASLKLTRGIGGASVFTKQLVDVVGYPGAYYGEAGIGHERSVSRRTTLAAAVGLGWGSAEYNRAYTGVSVAALNLVSFEASIAHASTDRLTLTPHVEVSYICDPRLRQRLGTGLLVSAGLTAKMGR